MQAFRPLVGCFARRSFASYGQAGLGDPGGRRTKLSSSTFGSSDIAFILEEGASSPCKLASSLEYRSNSSRRIVYAPALFPLTTCNVISELQLYQTLCKSDDDSSPAELPIK